MADDKKGSNGNKTGISVSGQVAGHIILWAILLLIGWIFATVLDHDRELSKRGPRINNLEKKQERMQDSWEKYKEGLFRGRG